MNDVFNSYLIYLNKSKINIWYPLIKYISLFHSLYIKKNIDYQLKDLKLKYYDYLIKRGLQ